MSSDSYNFFRSNQPQSIDETTPYSKLDFAYVQDLNSGIYSNGGSSTLVQFDLSSIYSNSMIDPSLFYLTIPLTYVCSYQQADGTLVPPVVSSFSQCSLKPNFMNLIHSLQFEMDGKTIEQNTPFQGLIQSIRQNFLMSKDDLVNFGTILGVGEMLDNPLSSTLNTATAGAGPYITGKGGNGLTNNRPYALSVAGSGSNYGQQPIASAYGLSSYNPSLQSRVNNILPFGTTGNPFYGTTSAESESKARQENRDYSVINGNYQIWYQTAVIRLKDILSSFDGLSLMKRFNGTLKIYINTGSFAVASSIVSTAGDLNPVYNLSGNQTTFSNTCPLMLNSLSQLAFSNVLISQITCGLFISKASVTSVTTGNTPSSNLGLSQASTAVPNCRIYYPLVKIKEAELGKYIQENTAKSIVFSAFLQNTLTGITSGSNYSQLIQSGVRAIKTVFIIPFISASVGVAPSTGYGNYGQSSCIKQADNSDGTVAVYPTIPFSPLLSPFESSTSNTGPISLTNINVQIGGQNVNQYLYSYTAQNFMEQIVEYNKINSGDCGISNGLYSSYYWNQYSRIYIVDCSRVENIENSVPRNIVVQMVNNSAFAIDCLVFTEYQDSFVVNVLTGLVTK